MSRRDFGDPNPRPLAESAERFVARVFAASRIAMSYVRGAMSTPDRSTSPSKVGSHPQGRVLRNAPPCPRPTLPSGWERVGVHDATLDADEARFATMASVDVTFQEFLEACFDYEPDRRRDWVIMEMLKMVREDLYDEIHGTALDCAGAVATIEQTLNYLELSWNQDEGSQE